MKIKIFILFAIIVWSHCNVCLHAQEELPDVLWSTDFSVRIAKFSSDGQYVYFVKNSDLTNLYKADAMTGEISGTFSYYSQYFTDFDFSPSGDTLVSTGGNQSDIVLWDTHSGDTLKIITSIFDSYGEKVRPNTIKFTPDGKRLIVVKGEEPKIVIINIANGEIIHEIYEKDASGLLDVSPDGNFFAFEYYANSWRNYIDIIDLSTYENLGTLENYVENTNYNYLVVPNNDIIVSCGYMPNYLYLWDSKTRKLLKAFNFDLPDFGDLFGFALTKDSKFVMVANVFDDDHTKNRISVFDLEKEKIIYTYPFEGSNLDISSDGYILSTDNYIMRMLNPTWMKYIGVKETKEEKINHTFYNGKLKIFFDENLINEPKINIYNILGVAVGANGSLPIQQSNEIEVDLNYLNSGIYFVVMDNRGIRRIVKVIKD